LQHSPAMMSIYLLASGYITYGQAEVFGASGIIATLFCSIALNLYMKPHMRESDELLTSFFIKQYASIGDMGIFLLVGVDASLIESTSLTFILWVMLFLLVARAVATFPLGIAVNACKRCSARNRHVKIRKTIKMTVRGEKFNSQEPQGEGATLSWKQMFMMWHAGLRGGIALVLCLQLGDWADLQNGEGTRALLTETTVAVIAVFLLVFGGSTQFCLKQLGISVGEEYADDHLSKNDVMDCTRRGFRRIDNYVLWPLLVGNASRRQYEEEKVEEENGLKAELDRRATTGLNGRQPGQSCDAVLMEMRQRHRGAHYIPEEDIEDFECFEEDEDSDDV